METFQWIIFNIILGILLLVDLFVFNRKSQEVKINRAIKWSIFWIGISLSFNVFIYFWRGSTAAVEFLTGYLIEKSLSIDNLFVFLMIFTYFKIPSKYHHKILFWGIFGALIFRAAFIFAGVALVEKFHFIVYGLGAFLIYGGTKMLLMKDDDPDFDPGNHPVMLYAKKILPIADKGHGGRFFIIKNKKFLFTPMFVVILIVETTDIVFALDSIPAILAISNDTFIIYTSNIFALLGLRALYFALAAFLNSFHYLKQGISIILIFVGAKIILGNFFKINLLVTLTFIILTLLVTVLISIYFPPKETKDDKTVNA